MSNILDIHINRTNAGRDIPFDKVYLVLKSDEHLIPKIFGYAVVLPLSAQIAEGLFELRPYLLTHKRFRRSDAEKNQAILYNGETFEKKHGKKELEDWWTQFAADYQFSERIVVVPVLTSLVRRKIRPRYLGTQRWFTEQSKKDRRRPRAPKVTLPTLNEFAYLATPHPEPNHKIEPICSICPRMLLHMQGECVPGELVCYKSLDFAVISEPLEESGDPDHAGVQSDHDHGT